MGRIQLVKFVKIAEKTVTFMELCHALLSFSFHISYSKIPKKEAKSGENCLFRGIDREQLSQGNAAVFSSFSPVYLVFF